MVEFLIFLYYSYVAQLASIPLINAILAGVFQVVSLSLFALWLWLIWGENAHKMEVRKTKPIPATPPCSRCEDTGFAPNPNQIGGLPVLCFCPVGQKMDNRIHNARDYKPRKPACTSCGDTGLLSLPGVKTTPCGCKNGAFYRRVEKIQ